MTSQSESNDSRGREAGVGRVVTLMLDAAEALYIHTFDLEMATTVRQ